MSTETTRFGRFNRHGARLGHDCSIRILICASSAPLPPLDGMRLQVRTLAEELARHHEVSVLALRWSDQVDDDGGPGGVDLRTIPAPSRTGAGRMWDRVEAVVRTRPVGWDRLARSLADELTSLLAERDFDVVHVVPDDVSGVAPLLDGRPSVIAPLDARHHNIRAQRYRASGVHRLWRRQQERAVRRHLAHALRPFGAAVFVTDQDAREAQRLDPHVRVAVIPLAIDPAHLVAPSGTGPRDPMRVLFTGVLAAPANEHAARRLAVDIMPLVRAELPGARLTLVGRSPSARLCDLAQRHGVEVVANVPDLRPWLWRAGAFACPMAHGTGSKNKLLEAMAAGAAAVATPLACRGIRARDGEHLLIAETDRELATGIVAILRNDDLRRRLGAAGRELVVADHAPSVVASRYLSLYEQVIAGSRQ